MVFVKRYIFNNIYCSIITTELDNFRKSQFPPGAATIVIFIVLLIVTRPPEERVTCARQTVCGKRRVHRKEFAPVYSKD